MTLGYFCAPGLLQCLARCRVTCVYQKSGTAASGSSGILHNLQQKATGLSTNRSMVDMHTDKDSCSLLSSGTASHTYF